MADSAYRTSNLILASRGISARYVDDAAPESTFLNMDNTEELAENSVGSRLGGTIINKTGETVNPIGGALNRIHSLAKLSGLFGSAFRYAGSLTVLYRRNSLTPGPYTQIANNLSGQPWQAVAYAPEISNVPTLFIADAARMLKDTGALSAPQQMGIFQPQYPVLAQTQTPTLAILDNYTGASTDYTYTGIGGGTISGYVTTFTTSPVPTTGVHSVNVNQPEQIGQFQLLTVGTGGGAEVVIVMQLTPTGFVADFTKTHASSESVASQQLSFVIPASTTVTVSKPISGFPFASWPTTLQQADYIGLYLFVSDPAQIKSITLKFDCGDGSFNTDYFYKVISQGPLQSLLDTVNDPTTASADSIIAQGLGIYANTPSGIAPLNSGLDQWTPFLLQLSDFAASGRADFNDAVHNWGAVNGYQIEVVTNDQSSATVGLASLVLIGGAGPDSFAGVAYDYLFTFYNSVDGTESNPCMVMTNIDPPLQTSWVLPRRQAVLLTLTYPTLDSQTTMLRVYRRGGTLGDNYRRVDEVFVTGSPQTYLDQASDQDIQAADFVSFTNDVPITSSLPTPVNTTLAAAISSFSIGAVTNVFPVSMVNISLAQQVTLGNLTSTSLTSNTETVIVLQLFPDHFTAFVQNTHAIAETVSATAKYGQPVTIMAEAFDQMWFAGDQQNPNELSFSAKGNPQAVSSAAHISITTPDDPITAVAKFKGNLYVSTVKNGWFVIAPGANQNANPIPYPTACKFGCIAPLGFVVTEEAIYYQAVDGIRAFAGGASMYLTQDQEFIFQDVGSTPIVEADPTRLSETRVAYWNNMIFFAYIGTDTVRHRLIYHTIYKRWRNDSIHASSILLEVDTNTLVFGDDSGVIHIDRVGMVDETNVSGSVANQPIQMSLQTPYRDQGVPANQKQYNEFTLDVNTNGMTVTVTLLFNDSDGENAFSIVLGTITSTGRERFNINLNDGDGYMAYKVAVLFTCSATQRVYLYQAAIRSVVLAKTRKSFDNYWLNFSTDESKLVKNKYVDYTSTQPIDVTVTYDDPAWPPFTFTLPSSAGKRSVQRVRLPAVKLRLMRTVGVSDEDFMIWNESAVDVKPICSGKGYGKFPMLNPEM